MPVLLGLLAAIGVVGVILWRMQQASAVAREAIEVAGDAHGLFRRFMWSRKANRSLLETVSDPREAAAAMMVAIAEYDGALTADEQALILAEMRYHFDADDKTAAELLARGRWLARERKDLGQFLKRLAGPIEKTCAPAEQRDLIAMLGKVAPANGEGVSVETHEIQMLEQHLLRRAR